MNFVWDRMRNLGAGLWPQGWTRQESIPVRLGRVQTGSLQAPVRLQSFDQVLVWVTVALLAWGLVMVYSATIALPDNPKFARYSHSHFVLRHMLWLATAFVAALIAFQVPVATWEKSAPLLFVVSLVLLTAVLIPQLGKGVNGARRWLVPVSYTHLTLPTKRIV